jgi:hypothetical protein
MSTHQQQEKFSQLFMMVIQETGGGFKGIQGLFEALFGFLRYRTNFFYEADPGDNSGFPPG